MRGLVKWVWRRKIILAAASSIAGLVMTKRRQAKLAAEAPAPALAPPSPPRVSPTPAAASAPSVTPTVTPTEPPPEAQKAEPTPEPALEPTPEPVASTPPPAAEVPSGAVPAAPDGSAPSPEYVVKGKLKSKIFHTQASTNYTRTKADVWFKNAADAEAAGFRGAKELKRPGT